MGLLLLRVGMGAMFVYHGAPKMLGGPATWQKLGTAMNAFGFDFLPGLWGLLAAVSEFGGGLLIAAGLLFRPACGALTATMLVAATMHLDRGDGFGKASHAVEAAILFVALVFIGPGRHVLHRPRL